MKGGIGLGYNAVDAMRSFPIPMTERIRRCGASVCHGAAVEFGEEESNASGD